MDRWLCAAFAGYALTFTFSKPMSIQQWFILATLVAVVSWRRALPRPYAIILGCVLCGIAWGSGNAYLHQNTLIFDENLSKPVSLQMTVTEITQVRSDFWRIQGEIQSIENQSLSRPATARLSWYEPPALVLPPQAGATWQCRVRLKAPQGVRN